MKNSADLWKNNIDKAFTSQPNVKLNSDTISDALKYKQGMKEDDDSETTEATGSGSSGAYSSPLFSGEEPKKVETKEATGSGSVGAYSTPAAWSKSTKKIDWGGKKKTQIPGGAFVSVKKKCSKFPYCNKGDINALDIYKNESVMEAIKNVSKKLKLNETVIKSILEYEYEKLTKRNK